MKKIFLITVTISLLVISSRVYSQVVYEPLGSSVYTFLDRMNLKGSIIIHDEVKPFSRIYIAGKLKVLGENKDLLTSLDKDELVFYEKEFALEISKIKNEKPAQQLSYFHNDISGRFRAFTFTSPNFTFMADPILGYSVSGIKGSLVSHLQNGASVYSYISDHFGFSINYRDNTESGNYLDYKKNFTPVTGIVQTGGAKNLQHDEVNAGLTANWSWGSFTFAKDYLNWGSGVNGQIILSSKAPSFPFIKTRYQSGKLVQVHLYPWMASFGNT